MLSLHGFEVEVVSDAQDLATYAPTTTQRTASGWIAGEVGKTFAIRMRQTATVKSPQFLARVYIDGKFCISRISVGADSMNISGINPTPTTVSPFQFAPLQITESLSRSAIHGSDDMGSLKITILRRIETGATLSMTDKIDETLTGSSAHERDKKRIIGGQSVITGRALQVARISTVHSVPYDHKDPDPYVTFIFRYRSRDYLLAEDIIPRLTVLKRPIEANSLPGEKDTVPAAKRPKKENEGGGSDDEDRKPPKRICLDDIEQTQIRIRKLKDELRNAEAALAEGLDLAPPNVKREPFPFTVGVTVDLTVSDDEEETGRQNKTGRRSTASTTVDLTDD